MVRGRRGGKGRGNLRNAKIECDVVCRVATKTVGSAIDGRFAWYARTVAEGCACAYGGKVFVATWRAASRLKESHRAINGDDGRPFEEGRKHVCGGIGRGNLRVAKTPPLQSAWAGIPLRCIATDHHLRPHGHQRERRMGGSRRGTPRRYVLREPGGSGLSRRIPKRERGERPGGQSFIGGIPYG